MPVPLRAAPLSSLSSFSSNVFEWLVDLAGAAIAVAIVVALLVVVVLLILRAPPVRRRVRYRIQGHGEVPWYLSWLAGTALHVEVFKGSTGAGDPAAVQAVLGAQLSGAGVRRPLAGVDLATTPYRTSSVLEDIGEAVKGLPRGKALASLIKLIQKLLPRYDLYVQGFLLYSPERGSGLVLNIISDAGQVKSSGTLWADILEPYSDPPVLGSPSGGNGAPPPANGTLPAGNGAQRPDDGANAGVDSSGGGTVTAAGKTKPTAGAALLSGAPTVAAPTTTPTAPPAAPGGKSVGDVLRLALAGAVWLQYQLLEETRRVDSRHVRTLQWRSAALFEVAVHDEGSRDHRGLRALYALALDRDPGNLPALFNLAVLELHDGCTPLACARLRTLLDALAQEQGQQLRTQARAAPVGESNAETGKEEEKKKKEKHGAADAPSSGHDPLFYQAEYTLAVARQTLVLETASTPLSTRAAELDGDGVTQLYQAAQELERDIETTKREVESAEDGCSSGAQLRTLQDARERLETLLRIEGPFLVMVAIRRQGQLEEPTFERMGDPIGGGRLAQGPFSRRQLIETLRSWEAGESATDRSRHPDPQTLAFGHVAGEDPEASYRTHYNRACYATCVAQRLAAAAGVADGKATPAPTAKPGSTQPTGVDGNAATASGREPRGEYEEALTWAIAKLECALEPGDLVGWAAIDPALRYLQEAEPEAFDAALGRRARSQPAPSGDLLAAGQR